MDETAMPDSGNWSHAYGGVEGASLRPFGVHWLDSALEETLLPGTPWEQIEEKVSRGLVSKLRTSDEFKDMEKKQMILQLLGAKFVEKHLRDEPYVPNILEPPRITLLKRQQLQRSMQKFLKDKLDDIARFHEYLPGTPLMGDGQRGLDARHEVLHSVEMRITQDHMGSVFQRGLNRHVGMNGYTADRIGRENTPDTNSPSMNAWSGTSNLLGHSLCAILQRDPHRLPYICKRLAGKQLPASLREFLWSEVLLRHSDSTVHAEKVSEKSLRKTFAKMVSKGKLEMKMSKATECPINGLISKAVQEKYENTVCMQQYKDTRFTTHCIEALNVLYTYNRSYEPYLVHWLFPIQLAFQDIADDSEDHPYELAFYLNLLQSNTYPRWPEIYAVAEQAMMRLQVADRELYDHLQTCSTSNVQVDPKEFMVQLLEDERKQAASLSWATTSHQLTGNTDSSKSLLANPVVFLRKWVGEGFVSVLDTQAVLFVWDQCFISDWSRKVLEDLCLVLVLLLRRDFMEATDYHQMKQVFLLKPCKLYTADIQAAFRHIQSGKPLPDVPPLDSRGTNIPEPAKETPRVVPMNITSPQVPAASTVSQGWTLRPVGLHEILLKLVLNQPDIRKAEDEELPQLDIIDQLVNFQLEKLSVSVSLCHDGKILEEKKCDGVGIMRQAPSLGRLNLFDDDRYTKIYFVSLSSEPMVFKDIKIEASASNLRDNPPEARVSVIYKLAGDKEPISLGWCALPLYKYNAGEADSTFAPVTVCEDKRTVPLSTGEPPQDITIASVQPEYKEDDHLQQGSCVTAVCIDPSKDEASELAITPPPEEPVWVLHDTDMAERSSLWKPEQGFDIYVDQVRFLTDNATIVKVTGRIVNPHNQSEADMLAIPLLDSSTRCPCFEYRNTTESAEKTSLAVFRAYTVDKATKELVAVGAAILPLYDGEEEPQLNVGGFQLEFHSGSPNSDAKPGVEALDKLEIVPCVSILLRVLPVTKIFIPAPDYASGYYHNSYASKPKPSHIDVMEGYIQQDNWTDNVKDTIEHLYQDEGGDTGKIPKGKDALTEWMIDRLDEGKHLPEGRETPGDLDITRSVNYDINYGLNIQVHMAPGIKGSGLYSQAVCQLLPGRQAARMDITPEGYGVFDRFHTKHHKFISLQNSPQWKDAPVKVHPHYDPSSVLLIRVFGLTLLYVPDPNEEGPGVIKGKHGKKTVKLGPESYLGWTLMPLFGKGTVAQGSYILPFFQDEKDLAFLEDVSKTDKLLKWLKTKARNNVIKIHRQFATVVVSLFDGHFPKAEAVKLPKRDHLLDVDDYQKFAESANLTKAGPKMCQHVLRGLPKEIQEEEMDSLKYKQEEKYFEQLALIVFDEILENVKEIGKE